MSENETAKSSADNLLQRADQNQCLLHNVHQDSRGNYVWKYCRYTISSRTNLKLRKVYGNVWKPEKIHQLPYQNVWIFFSSLCLCNFIVSLWEKQRAKDSQMCSLCASIIPLHLILQQAIALFENFVSRDEISGKILARIANDLAALHIVD